MNHSTLPPRLSALVGVHNEEERPTVGLSCREFGDERVVVLDRFPERSRAITQRSTGRIVERAWLIGRA